MLNGVMPARKYVDYEALEQSKQELAGIDSLSSRVSKEDRQREKADYKAVLFDRKQTSGFLLGEQRILQVFCRRD